MMDVLTFVTRIKRNSEGKSICYSEGNLSDSTAEIRNTDRCLFKVIDGDLLFWPLTNFFFGLITYLTSL